MNPIWQPLTIPSYTNKHEQTESPLVLETRDTVALTPKKKKKKHESNRVSQQQMSDQIGFEQIQKRLAEIQQRLALPLVKSSEGRIMRAVGLLLSATELVAPIGDLCQIFLPDRLLPAVVTGFKDGVTYLMPLETAAGVVPSCRVLSTGRPIAVPVGEALLGRIIDGLGRPLDSLGELGATEYQTLVTSPINPLHRQPIGEVLEVGIKAIDGLLTLGKGQRIGLFSTSGLGKSVLLGMMARYTKAEVVVIGLVGERGREVRDFITQHLGKDTLKRVVVVAAPADNMPMMRVNAAFMAMRIASAFSAEGKHVLVLMDSLSRVADAQREVALSMGEPSGLKGYPPSVFQCLAQLVEMAGCFGSGRGSVTALLTVLAQDERASDPVASTARAILDGHVVLSREYAEQGRYPAIDLEASVSRVMNQVVSKRRRDNARQFRRWHAIYRENKDLINMGVYTPGVDAEVDIAMQKHSDMEHFLKQEEDQFFSVAETNALMNAVLKTDTQKKEATA